MFLYDTRHTVAGKSTDVPRGSGSPDESECVRVDIVLCDFPRFGRRSGWIGNEHECLREHSGLVVHRLGRPCRWVPNESATMSHGT